MIPLLFAASGILHLFPALISPFEPNSTYRVWASFCASSLFAVWGGILRYRRMIKATRLNGMEFVINAELIQFLEETPDTVITLVNHEKVVVKEPVDEVIRRVIEYSRSIRSYPS